MNQAMSFMIPVAGILLAFSSGCTSVSGIKPIQPKFGQVVGDLQPVLEWQADPDGDVTYDLSISEKKPKGESKELSKKSKYYREGLVGTSHQVEAGALKPGTLYTWALRPRKGEETGDWNKHKSMLFLGVYFQNTKKPFEFRTP